MHNEPSSFLLLRLCSSPLGAVAQICEAKFIDLSRSDRHFFFQLTDLGNGKRRVGKEKTSEKGDTTFKRDINSRENLERHEENLTSTQIR